MKVLLRNQNSHELFLLGLQEIAGLGYSGNPSRSVNCAVDFLRLPHPLNLKKNNRGWLFFRGPQCCCQCFGIDSLSCP